MQENIDFKNLYDQYVRMVFNLCLKYLQSIEDAEDLTQEVFITVFKSIHQFKGESKISTWIYKIAITKSLEFIRMKKRKKRFAFFQSIFSNEKGEINISDVHFHHPGIQLENKERAAILFNAIDKLPENQKTAYILCKLEDLSYNEIAEIMKVTVPSVESLLFRAKQNLQKILGNYYEKNEK
jgi:RNA polymerase sigma-70 factor (ECF subfamily)